MDYHKHTVEDFVLDPNFKKWVFDPDHETNIFWNNWAKNHPEKINDLKEARQILYYLTAKSPGMDEKEVETLWHSIDRHITEAPSSLPKQKVVPLHSKGILEVDYFSNKSRKMNYQTIAMIAASVILIFVVGISFFIDKVEEKIIKQPTLVIKETSWGQKSSIFLSDGTEVKLNSGSNLEYYQEFSEDERRVILHGEAFFNVAKDENRPFRVISGDIVTEALGTSFNIQAYDDQPLKVALVSGKVAVDKVGDDHDVNTMILTPGEEAEYEPDFGLKKNYFDPIGVLAWKDGIIYFKNADEKEVFDALEKWYGIEINKINHSAKKWDYTGSFKNQSLEYVLMSIGFAMDFNFNINDKSIELKYN